MNVGRHAFMGAPGLYASTRAKGHRQTGHRLLPGRQTSQERQDMVQQTCARGVPDFHLHRPHHFPIKRRR